MYHISKERDDVTCLFTNNLLYRISVKNKSKNETLEVA